VRRLSPAPAAAFVVALALVPACDVPRGPSAASRSLPRRTVTPLEVDFASSPTEIRVDYSRVRVPAEIRAGSVGQVRLTVRNRSTQLWNSSGPSALEFGYHWADPDRRGDWDSIIWDDGHRGRLTRIVRPEETGTVTIPVLAPAVPGPAYRLVIAPVLEGPNGGWKTDAPYVTTVCVR
jgi:hypothetical protein